MRIKLMLLSIFVLGCIFRFAFLSDIPSGITSDEANTGYDAYSILLTGKDQWGKFLPLVSFQGFGDYRSPLYTYLAIPFIAMFDLNALAVRLPSAIAGALSIWGIYLLTRKLINQNTGLIAALLFAVAPWSIGLSRQGVESNVAIAFTIFAIYFFVGALERKKLIYISILFLILSMYTYTAYLLFAPLAFVILMIVKRHYFKKKKLHLILASCLFLIALLPMVLTTSAGSTRISQVGLTNNISSIGIVDVLNQRIGSCMEMLPTMVCRVFENKFTTFGAVFIKNYISHFSPEFLYMNGTTTQFSILPARGLLYLFEFVFFVGGVFFILAKRKYRIILVFLLLAPIPDALSSAGHHSRASVMLPFLIIIEAIGFVYILKLIKNIKTKFLARGFVVGLIGVIIFSVTVFSVTYFNHFKKHYSSYSLSVYQDLSRDLFLQQKNYDQLYLSTYLNDTQQYIFYLFYNKYPPHIYQQKKYVEYEISENGFIKVTKIDNINFGNYVFIQTIKDIDQTGNNLYIGHPDSFVKDQPSVTEYNELTGGAIFKAVKSKDLVKVSD